MEYRGHEIFARTHVTGNRLWSLNVDGTLDEVEYEGPHDDDTVVWYEVECINPRTGFTEQMVELETIEDAEKAVDESIAWCKENIKDYEEDE